MKILAFESSAKTASVALSDEGRLLGEMTIDAGRTHSEILLPMAEDLLKQLKLTFGDIDGYAVTVGPGSFTGIRIGVATVKGLAFGKGAPCFGISSLEGLAYNLRGLRGIIVPVLDCRRNECYTAIFSSDGETIVRLSEDTQMRIVDLAPLLSEHASTPIYLVGDSYEKAKELLGALGIQTMITPEEMRLPSASSLLRIADERYQRGEYTDDSALTALYLKPAQAERERLEKEKQNKGDI